MNEPVILPDYLQKAINTHKIHVANLRGHDKWTIIQTAKALSRSKSSIADDIMIARWYRIHPKRLESIKTTKDALEWIRDKEKEVEREDV